MSVRDLRSQRRPGDRLRIARRRPGPGWHRRAGASELFRGLSSRRRRSVRRGAPPASWARRSRASCQCDRSSWLDLRRARASGKNGRCVPRTLASTQRAQRGGAAMNVHDSLHDVSPAWAPEVEMAILLARRHGVKPALLVVPDFHGAWPLLAHPSFCRRLKELSREGCETYLHGFLHRAGPGSASTLSERIRRFVAQRCVSDREAEFSDLTESEASFRLEQGERVLAHADLPISGFVPPAWSMPRWLVPMLGARSYRFAEDHTRIYDPLRARSRASLVLNFAT